MTDWGWGPALILAIGIMMVIWGVGAFVSELIRKAREHNRAMRQAERRLNVGQDLKDLNS